MGAFSNNNMTWPYVYSFKYIDFVFNNILSFFPYSSSLKNNMSILCSFHQWISTYFIINIYLTAIEF
jgi:hypothetical protein